MRERSSRCRRGPCSSPRARRPTSSTRRNCPARSSSMRRRSSSSRTAGRSVATARLSRARAGRARLLHVLRAGGRFVTYYGDNHPRYAGNVVKAMASAKDGYPHVVELFARRAGGARSGARSRSATRPGERSCSGSTTDFHGARRRRRAPHADHRRSDRQGAGGGAAFPSRSVLPAAELRVASPAVRVDGRRRRC